MSMDGRVRRSELQQADFLLVGGGLASATAAASLRGGAETGSVTMLCAEQLPPYNRPPLSKGLLLEDKDEAQIFIHPESFYRDRAIDLRLNTRVLSVDTAKQV